MNTYEVHEFRDRITTIYAERMETHESGGDTVVLFYAGDPSMVVGITRNPWAVYMKETN